MFILSIIRLNLGVISSNVIHVSSKLTRLRKKLTWISPDQAFFCNAQEFLSADAGIIGTDSTVDTPPQSHGRRRQVIRRVSLQHHDWNHQPMEQMQQIGHTANICIICYICWSYCQVEVSEQVYSKNSSLWNKIKTRLRKYGLSKKRN